MLRRANSVEKMQVFWPWSSFRMSACTVPRIVASVRAVTSARSSLLRESRDASARSSWSSTAQARNIARMVGAGPLMVIETDVEGSHRSKPRKSSRMSSIVAMLTPEVPTLP